MVIRNIKFIINVEGVQELKSLKDAPPKNRERCILSIGGTFATGDDRN